MDKREAITAVNLGPVVSVLTWVMTASVLLAVGIKLTLSSLIPKRRNKEDVALCLATVRNQIWDIPIPGKYADII